MMDLFIAADDKVKAQVRPQLVKLAEDKLQQLAAALGRKEYLVGDSFTIADLMTSSVFKVIHHTDMLDRFPALQAYRDRCFARPAYKKAIADQLAELTSHSERDMKYELRKAG